MAETRKVSSVRMTHVLTFALAVASSVASGALYADPAAENSPPRIVYTGSALYGGIAYVTGYVVDDDDNTEGWTVYISGDITGTATIGADGKFWFRTPYVLSLRRRSSPDAGSARCSVEC